MMPRIAKATAGGVMTALADATFFAAGFAVDPDGFPISFGEAAKK